VTGFSEVPSSRSPDVPGANDPDIDSVLLTVCG
jgi:hypothetical protein